MSVSNFEFSNPQLVKLLFYKNEEYIKKEEDDKTEVGISVSSGINKLSDNEAVVELSVDIGEESDQFPFYINLVMGAKFRLSQNIEGTDFDQLLEVNAPALLLAYARPIISSVSGQAGMKPINLPFINFTK